MSIFRRYELQFFTATILEWKRLLRPKKYKDIIINSLRFLVAEKRVLIHGFVIMDNHIHLIWHILYPHHRADVQRDLLKFTAQMIRFDLMENHPDALKAFLVNAKDRKYQFWERNALSVDIYTERVLIQKLCYIHMNPVKAGLAALMIDYYYSSARFHETGIDDFGFLAPCD